MLHSKEHKTEKHKQWPKIMKGKEYGTLVLFNQARMGTIILSHVDSLKIGDVRTNWAMETFVEWSGEVTLVQD